MNAGGLALLFSLALTAPAYGAAADFKSLDYFRYDTHEFFVGTNTTWSHAKALNPAYAPSGNRPPWAYNRLQPMGLIWLPECGKRSQVAEFRMPIRLPGALSSGRAFIELWDPHARSRPRDVQLLVNGHVVARWKPGGSSFGEELAPAALRAFRYGRNTIELRARRPRLPKGTRRCNGGSGEKVGIVAGLSGKAGVDIRVGTGEKVVYRRGALGNGIATTLEINVFNDGPATSVEGLFGITFNSGRYRDLGYTPQSGDPVGVLVAAPAPFGECRVRRFDVGFGGVECPWTDFPPGGHALITVYIFATMHKEDQVPGNVSWTSWDANWFAAPGTHTWQGTTWTGSGTDADVDTARGVSDNTFGSTEVICFREPADNPGCANASR